MNSFIWISSYPRSGNTWLRFIILDLIFNKKNKSSYANEYVPDIHKLTSDGKYVHPKYLIFDKEILFKNQIFIKNHFLYSEEFRDNTSKIIYILRNPLDVLTSLLNFYLVSESKKNNFIDFFTKNRTYPGFIKCGFGTWENHFHSWNNTEFETLFLTYENLLTNPKNNIKKISDFLGLDVNEDRIDEIYRNTKFNNLKKIEEYERKNKTVGLFSDTHKKKEGLNFMYKGNYGNYKNILSKKQISYLY